MTSRTPAKTTNERQARALVEHWMTRNVATVKPHDTIQHARELLEQRRINQVPVVVDGRVVGILTDRDVRDATPSVFDFTAFGEVKKGHEVVDPSSIIVESVMTPEAVTLGPGETVFAAARLLRTRRIGAVPIVADGRLVGILARSDLLHALTSLCEEGSLSREES